MADHLTKDDIIKAVLDTSFLLSAGAASLSDIAGALNIKKASLYNHFENRDDLFDKSLDSCREYYKEISFIPSDIESVAKKYPAATVFKGIVTRYVKMHEKSPLFQIYTFIESQKYFNMKAAEIVQEEEEKILSQTKIVLETLLKVGKLSISEPMIPSAAKWFCSGFKTIMGNYLIERKKLIVSNPRDGEGELFSLPTDEEGLEMINAFLEDFCKLI